MVCWDATASHCSETAAGTIRIVSVLCQKPGALFLSAQITTCTQSKDTAVTITEFVRSVLKTQTRDCCTWNSM